MIRSLRPATLHATTGRTDPNLGRPGHTSRRAALRFAAVAACAPALAAYQHSSAAAASRTPTLWEDPTARKAQSAVTTSRSGLVTGAYLPSATTTGVPSGTVLTDVTSSATFSGTNAEIIRGKRFLNYVYLTGSNKQFENCEFAGPAASTQATVTAVYSGSSKNVFTDCTFRARAHNDKAGNLIGRGVRLLRCNISNGVDGLGAAPAAGGTRVDMIVEACWIHDLAYFRPSSTHSDGQTHSDGIQWHGGAGLTVIGTRLESFAAQTFGTIQGVIGGLPAARCGFKIGLSALMVNQQGTLLPSELRFENNWIDGGAVGINLLGCPTAFPAGNGSRIANNRFGVKFGYSQNHAIVGKASQTYALTGNARWIASDPMNKSTVFNLRLNG